eukprot:1136602-Pelagomonas_calceolata.AAC.3
MDSDLENANLFPPLQDEDDDAFAHVSGFAQILTGTTSAPAVGFSVQTSTPQSLEANSPSSLPPPQSVYEALQRKDIPPNWPHIDTLPPVNERQGFLWTVLDAGQALQLPSSEKLEATATPYILCPGDGTRVLCNKQFSVLYNTVGRRTTGWQV